MGMDIVSVADLKLGMFVVEPDCPWTELPFALQGFVISTPTQVEIFQSKCRFVQVDFSRSLNEYYRENKRERDRPLRSAPFARAEPKAEPGRTQRRPTFTQLAVDEGLRSRRQRFLGFLQQQDGSEYARELGGELDFIEPRFDDFQHTLHNTFKHVEAEQNIDLRQVREGLQDMAGSLKRNPDALVWLLRLRQIDEYSFDHAIDVAVYLLMLGSHIGWRGLRLIELGLAGLLQDVGKSQLPQTLLAKAGQLSADEQALVRSHVASSLEILFAHAHLSSEVLVIVSRHHERWDGSGYPRGLSGNQIGLGGEMAGLVDSFCAMLKHQPYRNALGHQGALEAIYNQRNRQFNPALLEQFVQCVGLYPIGTLVELDSGEIGVVIQQNRVQRSRPRILLLLDRQKEAVPGYKVLDLRDKSSQKLHVAQTLPPDAYGLSSDDFYLR
jgi:HD-GYP domain-containing protein (c-di-GMP phosphodiesterase class II)